MIKLKATALALLLAAIALGLAACGSSTYSSYSTGAVSYGSSSGGS